MSFPLSCMLILRQWLHASCGRHVSGTHRARSGLLDWGRGRYGKSMIQQRCENLGLMMLGCTIIHVTIACFRGNGLDTDFWGGLRLIWVWLRLGSNLSPPLIVCWQLNCGTDPQHKHRLDRSIQWLAAHGVSGAWRHTLYKDDEAINPLHLRFWFGACED